MVALNNHGNGKPPDPLGDARGWFAAAMKLTCPAALADAAGCLEVFACVIRLALAEGQVSTLTEQKLTRAVVEADLATDPAARSTVFRDVFVQLLGKEPDDESEEDDDPLILAQDYIETAISIGAPAYNAGDHHGCYEVYACTARMVLASVEELPIVAAGRLKAALDQATRLSDPNRRAWAMRHGFDDVLGMVPKNPEPVAPEQVVPIFLKLAIQIGAPAFNAGDHRGCYEVYACVARLMLRTVAGADDTKDTLRDALQDAALTPDVTEQAWIMRRAFDEVISGKSDDASAEE